MPDADAFVSALHRYAEHVFTQAGLAPDIVREQAQRLVYMVQADWGATTPYIHAQDRSARDQAIVAAMQTGDKLSAARAVGVSVRTVSRALRRVRSPGVK